MAAGIKRVLTLTGVLLAGGILSGCVGGTTYGTGVSQEQQTIEDLANLITFKKKKRDIDYQSRPDLVVPEDKVLVNPQPKDENASDTDWPESPEQRIARVRAEAEEAEKTTAGQIAYAKKEKRFRSIKPGSSAVPTAPIGQGIPNVTCDPIRGGAMRQCTAGEISNAVRAQRKEIKSVGKTGYQRRYLTEPPLEYRTPTDTAVEGDLGYTEAELKKMAAEKKAREWKQATHPDG